MTNKQEQFVNQIDNIFNSRGNANCNSYSTKISYQKACHTFGKWVAENSNIGKIKNITNKDVYEFFENNKDLSAATKMKYLSAIRFMADKGNFKRLHLPEDNKKFGLEKRNSGHVYRAVSEREYNTMRTEAYNKGNIRAYCSCTLQYQLGLRTEESVLVRKDQLEKALTTGKLVMEGKQCKHGRPRTIEIHTQEQRDAIKEVLEKTKDSGTYNLAGSDTKKARESVNQFVYRNREVATDRIYRDSIDTKKTVEQYYSSHGQRHAYAQREYEYYISKGYTKEQAEFAVSRQLGHNREEITRIYLK